MMEYEYPFENMDDETKEILKTSENAQLIYRKIIELPEQDRMDAMVMSILVLSGVATAEQAIEWHDRKGMRQ